MTTFSFGGVHRYANSLPPEYITKCILLDVQLFDQAPSFNRPPYAVTRPYGGSNAAALCRYDNKSNSYRVVNIHEPLDEVFKIIVNPQDYGLQWMDKYHV